MKKLITDLKENECVVCYTEEEAKAISKMINCSQQFMGKPICYYYVNSTFGQWSDLAHATEQGYKVHPASDFLTEKEIIRYKLKDEKYYNAVSMLLYGNTEGSRAIKEGTEMSERSKEVLSKAGVLDLWFEPVYKEPEFKVGDFVVVEKEEVGGNHFRGNIPELCKGFIGEIENCDEMSGLYKGHKWVLIKGQNSKIISSLLRHATPEEIEAYNSPKLPEINGYEGEIEGNKLKYGCAYLSKKWFNDSENRHIKSMTLSSGVEINEEQVNQIRKYLAK